MNQMQNNGSYLLFKFPHLVDTHPTYWSYLLIFGNSILLGNTVFVFFEKKYVAWAMFFVFNLTLLFLASRTALVVNGLIILVAFVLLQKKMRTYSRTRIFSILSTLGVFLMILIVMAPRKNLLMLKFMESFEDDRFYLWPIAMKQIKENFFVIGEGLGLGIGLLRKSIIEFGDVRKNYNSFDLHNQYLKHYLDMGILGFGALIYLITAPLVKIKNSFSHPSSFLILSMVLLISFACLTEAPLYRLKGIVIFSIFYPVFLLATHMSKSRPGKSAKNNTGLARD